MVEFRFSEAVVAKKAKVCLFVVLGSVPIQLGFGIYALDVAPVSALLYSTVTIAIMFVIFAIEYAVIAERGRHTMILVDEEKLIKRAGIKEEAFRWDRVVAVSIMVTPGLKTARITLGDGCGRTLELFNFDGMEDLATIVKQRIPKAALVDTKRLRVNPESPLVIGAFFVLGLIVGFPLVFLLVRYGVHPIIKNLMNIILG